MFISWGLPALKFYLCFSDTDEQSFKAVHGWNHAITMKSEKKKNTKPQPLAPTSQTNGADTIEMFLKWSLELRWVMRCESRQVARALEWQGKYFTQLKVPLSSSLPSLQSSHTSSWSPTCPLGSGKAAIAPRCRGDYQVIELFSAPSLFKSSWGPWSKSSFIIWAKIHWIAPFSDKGMSKAAVSLNKCIQRAQTVSALCTNV